MRWNLLFALVLIAGCAGSEPETGMISDAVSCGPQMSTFPVGEPHNIGYDASSCGSGTCQVSCPDQHANSDWGGRHHGIDVFARRGAPLVAVASGTIVAVSVPSSTSGLRVRLRDACGWEYYYGHLDEAVVSRNQQVQAGQLIGYMGNTGTSGVHLHFNISPDGAYSNDINPFQLLQSTSPTACSAPPPPPATPPPPPSTPPTPPANACGVLLANEFLAAGVSFPACNGAYRLDHQTDGNIVLYNNASGAAVWFSGTNGGGTRSLNMQTDGNLVLYANDGSARWASGTNVQNGPSALVVHDDGNLVVYGPNFSVLWSTDTSNAGTPGCGVLGSGGTLAPNQGVWSCGGRFLFVHQGDGNVVFYDQRRGVPLWSSETSGQPSGSLAMQTDGNLVLYAPWGDALWSSGTQGNDGAFLGVQDDGNAVIYSGGGAVWATRHR